MRHSAFFLSICFIGCFNAKHNDLFSHSDAVGTTDMTHQAGSAAVQAGTGSSTNVAGSGESGGMPGAPSGGAGATAGSASGASGGSGGANGGSGGAQAAPTITSCDMLEGAVVNEQNGHCYRLSTDELSFTAARDACRAAGGHLVSLSDETENSFVHDLHDGEHWIGATDGRDDRASGVGTYGWVDEEPWSYADWEQGQPNAHAIDCPDEDGGAHCYEHCGYQNGDGIWIDRACWNTIASVCEWDLEPQLAPAGAGGSP